jgi:prevent-host-death family protein
MPTWKLEDAKNQFSRLVREARRRGPQIVTRHGREEAVVMSIEQYRAFSRKAGSLSVFLRESPLAQALASGDLALTRSPDLPRDLEP